MGYYHANEYMDDMELPVSAKKIASKIASHCPQAAALLVKHRPAPYLGSGVALCVPKQTADRVTSVPLRTTGFVRCGDGRRWLGRWTARC